jgi:serine protease Do
MKEEEVVASTAEKGELGLTVQQVTPQIAESLGLERADGVVITALEPGSPADDAGLRRGDIIMEVDRKPVRKVADFRKAVGEVKKGKGVLFLVRRGESTLFLALKPPR